MLKNKFRGLKPSEVSELFDRNNDSYANRYFRVNVKDTENKFSKFVVIVTPKVMKSAVKRNRIRRHLYSIVERKYSGWTDGKRVAILVKKYDLDIDKTTMEAEFVEVMKRAKLFC